MKNLIFKPLDISIDLSEFSDNITYLCNSIIDKYPVYQTSDNLMFNDYIIDMLNNRDRYNLELMLRRKKIEKIIKGDKLVLSLQYEFLNFWYDNFDNLTIIKPMEDYISDFRKY